MRTAARRRTELSLSWDGLQSTAKGNRAKGKSVEARETNLALDNIKAQIIKHYQRISDREAYVTAEMVRNAYQGIGCEYETILGAFDKENAKFLKRVGKDRCIGSYRVMVRSRNYVAAFIKSFYKRNDMSMLELTPDFIKEFSVFLTTEQGLKNATIWLACMWVKTIVSRAHYNGLIPRNPFAQFRITPNVKEREYLTEGEIRQLIEHEFADATLAFTRDLFVFACFTALSFADIRELTTDDIMDVNGEKWIISKRHKTGVPFQVKLLDIPLQIIGKYRPFQKDNSVFGEINYWSICKKLKNVIRECGINKQISFHCSRHTFGTLALSKGMPIESVSRVLGHTNIKTTQIYAKITTQKLGNDLTAFGNCRTVRCRQCMDERNGVGGTFRCYRPYTPCRHTSRVQKRSVEPLRSGKAHQAAQRLLYERVRLTNSRGTCFPYQYFKCGNGA